MKTKISKRDIIDRLDQHFEIDLCGDEYDLLYVKAPSLITCNRLDLAFKILYLETKDFAGIRFSKKLYLSHIRALSLGSFKEPGNDNKNSGQEYLNEFEGVFQSIKKHGVEVKKSVIPLSRNGSIANGAHRVASAFVLNKTLPVVKLGTSDHNYDYDFFLHRGMSGSEVEIAVTKFVEYAENCHVALIWPRADGRESEVLKIIPNIIYRNRVSLNYQGAHSLISQIYYGEGWLGDRRDNYPGARNKLVECFRTFGQLRVIVFQSESLDKTQSIKEDIRQLFNIGKHSIHITDSKEEAIRVARILFNKNSIHFLNYANPNKFPTAINGIIQFKSFLARNKIDPGSVVIDSSHILSLYGIREAKDIDYLAREAVIEFKNELIEDHSSELRFHHEELNELIYCSKFHFYYEDLKFVSFDQLYRMKKNRGEPKDLNDRILMDALIENSLIKNYVGLLRQKCYYFSAKLKLQVITILKFFGLYRLARSIYRKLSKQSHK